MTTLLSPPPTKVTARVCFAVRRHVPCSPPPPTFCLANLCESPSSPVTSIDFLFFSSAGLSEIHRFLPWTISCCPPLHLFSLPVFHLMPLWPHFFALPWLLGWLVPPFRLLSTEVPRSLFPVAPFASGLRHVFSPIERTPNFPYWTFVPGIS